MRALASLILCAVLFVGPASVLAQPSSRRGPARATGPLADGLRAFAVDMGAILRAMNVDALTRLYGTPRISCTSRTVS